MPDRKEFHSGNTHGYSEADLTALNDAFEMKVWCRRVNTPNEDAAAHKAWRFKTGNTLLMLYELGLRGRDLLSGEKSEVVKLAAGLLSIASHSMPALFLETDSRCQLARAVLIRHGYDPDNLIFVDV